MESGKIEQHTDLINNFMKIIENPINIINRIFNASELPEYVFRERYDQYIFMPSGYVMCSGFDESFSEKIFLFIKGVGDTETFYLSNLTPKCNCLSFLFNSHNTPQDYLAAVDLEIKNKYHSIMSCWFGVGIFSKSKNWVIYCESNSEIAVMGINNPFFKLAVECFSDFIFKSPNDIKKEMKIAYQEISFENIFSQLVKNYSLL